MKISNRKLRQLICILVCIVMIMPSLVFADSLTDVRGHWAESMIAKWVDKGYINSYGDGTFKPDRSITRAEFMAIVNRAFGLKDAVQSLNYKDVKKSDWFYEDVAKAVKAGYMNGSGNNMMQPGSYITNQEVAVVIAKLLKLGASSGYDLASKFTDSANIPDWSLDAVKAVVSKGYMKGYSDQTFKPAKPVTRAEAVAALDSCYLKHQKKAFYKAGEYSEGTVEGSLLIGSRNVTLKDTVINGDLILAEEIGDGDVHINNVTVKGETIIKGGGMNSIYLENSSFTNIIIIKVDNRIRVVASGSTRVDSVNMQSGARLEEQGVTGTGFGFVTIAEEAAENASIILSGNFESIQLMADNVDLSLLSGNIANLNITQQGGASNINIASGSTVTNMRLDAPINITGSGSIQNAQVNAPGSTLGINPSVLSNPGGLRVTVISPAAPASSPTTSGGGGGGGGNPGGGNTISTVTFTSISTKKVEIGNTLEVEISRTPASATVSANSSNLAVATVSGPGLGDRLTITGVSEGSCAITLTGSKDGYLMGTTSFNVTVVPENSGDIIPPELLDVEVLNSSSIKLLFDEELDEVSAETAANYGIDNGIGAASTAVLNADKKSVTLEFPYHFMKNKIYKVSVLDVEDMHDNKCSDVKSFVSTCDIPVELEPAKLSDFEVLSYSSIKLIFDKALERTSAENEANYTIDNGIGAVSSAILEGDGKTVILTIPGAFMKHEAYKLHILDVKDAADNRCNIVRTFFSPFDVPVGLIPPKVLTVEIIYDTTLRVRFNEVVEEASAETLSNYHIDNGMGNPTAATLSEDGMSVLLTIPRLSPGILYYISMSNVRDIDGNKMIPKTRGLRLPDTGMPTVESAVAKSSNELWLQFSEEVEAYGAARVVVSYGDVKEYADLKAVGGTAIGDGRVVVFKVNRHMGDGESEDQPGAFGGTAFLMENIQYTIESVSYVRDMYGNVYNAGSDEQISFTGRADANSRPEIIASEQTGGRTFRVVFSEPMISPGGTIVSSSSTAFNISDRDPDYDYTDDGYSTIDLTAGVALTEESYSFDFSAVPGLTDFCGSPVKDIGDGDDDDSGLTELAATYEDNEAPYIVDVQAIDNKEIRVYFNESISYAGAYRITYNDGGVNTIVPNTAAIHPDDGMAVCIIPLEELSGSIVYTLKQLVGARDSAGNIAEGVGDAYEFVGSDVDDDYIMGVEVNSGKQIKVRCTTPIDIAHGDTIKVYREDDAAKEDMIESISGMGTTNLTISTKSPLLDAYNYVVETTGEVNDSYYFDGVILDGGLDVNNGIITFSGYNSTDYVVYVVYDDTPSLIVPATPLSDFNALTILNGLEYGDEYAIEVYKADRKQDVVGNNWASPYGEYSETENLDGFVLGELWYYITRIME